jgi:hypothetical protein
MAKARPQAGLAARPLGSRREYWRTVVDEWRRSGLGQSEFCRRRGLRAGTLAWWKHMLARQPEAPPLKSSGSAGAVAPPRVTFVPLRITPARAVQVTTTLSARTDAADGELEIVLDDARRVRVRVRGRVDPHWLGQVIDVLTRARC